MGGAVRDQLLGKAALDYDLCTDARPESILGLFRRVIPTGIKHGTVSILIREKSYEVTTFRSDGKYSDSRRPDSVTFGHSLEEDLKRRDFTINSLAYDPLEQTLHDPNNGQADLKRGIIRAIGRGEERFTEDGLRSIRACRFAAQLGFKVDLDTKKSIRACLSALGGLSKERIYDELVKIIKTPRPSLAFKLFRETGLLDLLFPELAASPRTEEALKICDALPPSEEDIRFAGLFHLLKDDSEASCQEAESVMTHYRFPKGRMTRVLHLIKYQKPGYNTEWEASDIRNFIRQVGPEELGGLLTFLEGQQRGAAQGLSKEKWEQLAKSCAQEMRGEAIYKIKDLAINGRDIMEHTGLPGGPRLGAVLEELLDLVIQEPLRNDKETLLSLAEDILNRP